MPATGPNAPPRLEPPPLGAPCTPRDDERKLFLGVAKDIVVKRTIERRKQIRVLGNLYDYDVVVKYEIENFKDQAAVLDLTESLRALRKEIHRDTGRDVEREERIVYVGDVPVGGDHCAMIAGPCAVETHDQLFASAEAVHKAGARILRGDAFKPRTSPYSFQGLGEKGLEMLAEARDEFGMPFVAEVVEPRDVRLVPSSAALIL